MDVGVDSLGVDSLKVSQFDFLANLGNLVGDALTDLTAIEVHLHHLVLGGEVLCHSSVENRGGESDKVGVGGDKVGLAAQHHDSAVFASAFCEDATFVGVTVSTFGGHLLAFLTQQFNGFLHIAVALNEGFLAVHHTYAGKLAQFINLFCGDCCHILFS